MTAVAFSGFVGSRNVGPTTRRNFAAALVFLMVSGPVGAHAEEDPKPIDAAGAWREGPALVIDTARGVRTFTNIPCGSETPAETLHCRRHRLIVGQTGGLSVVEITHYEDRDYAVVDRNTGQVFEVRGEPLLSPDPRLFASVDQHGNPDFGLPPGIEVWSKAAVDGWWRRQWQTALPEQWTLGVPRWTDTRSFVLIARTDGWAATSADKKDFELTALWNGFYWTLNGLPSKSGEALP
ncbi:MAG TPA: hypothetical protein VK196_10030 [Magnetospirillum sp.]|nr:hypothetical protein [Magnetospirillum sp.]